MRKQLKQHQLLAITALIFIMSVGKSNAQQVPLYNQYYYAPSLAFPSSNVFQENRQLSLMYRDQFGGLIGSPKNSGLAYTSAVGGRKAFNANITTADIGFTSQLKISTGLGYKLFGKEGDGLSIGTQVGLSLFSLNEERVNPENPIDNALADLLGQNGSTFSLDLSLSYRLKNLSIDLAMPNIINQSLSDDAYFQINEDNLPNFIGGVSYKFNVNPNITFKPYLGARLRETIGVELDVMGEFNYKEKFKLFGGYRDNYGASAGIGVQLSSSLLFTYNYDIGQKNVPFLAEGFNEFGLHFRLKNKEKEEGDEIQEGQALMERIASERIYDENLINPEDKRKALRYLSSLEEGSRREKNKSAEVAYRTIFEKIKKEEIAKSEVQRQARLNEVRQEEQRRIDVQAEEARIAEVARLKEESAKKETVQAPLKEQEKVVSLEDVKNGEPKNVLPISQEKAKEINQIFELATKTVSFKSNSTELQLRSIGPLDQVFDLLLDNSGLKISLSGYTDNTGDDEFNLTLSKQRAERVKAYLVNKGIAADRITADGYGNTNPISNNNYDWGRALNRRVEIKIIEE